MKLSLRTDKNWEGWFISLSFKLCNKKTSAGGILWKLETVKSVFLIYLHQSYLFEL